MRRVVAMILLGCGAGEPATPPADSGPPAFTSCAEPTIPSAEGCVAVGVDACGEGMIKDATGGCTATIADGCTREQLSLPGEACKPIDACPAGPFAAAEGPETTRYVASGATTGDGSRDRPFATIAEAIAALPSGGRIMLAAGSYDAIATSAPLRIVGVCASRVTVGSIAAKAPLTLEGLSITGAGAGVDTNSDLTMRRVSVFNTGGAGLRVEGLAATRVVLETVVIDGATGRGLQVGGGNAELTNLAVRRTRAAADGVGVGIALINARDHAPGVAKVSRATITATTGLGVLVQSTTVRLESTVIRDVSPGKSSLETGHGLYVTPDPSEKAPAAVTVVGSIIERVRFAGVELRAGALTMSTTTVRDVTPGPSDKHGYGLYVSDAASATVDRSVFEKLGKAGLSPGDDEGHSLHRARHVREAVARRGAGDRGHRRDARGGAGGGHARTAVARPRDVGRRLHRGRQRRAPPLARARRRRRCRWPIRRRRRCAAARDGRGDVARERVHPVGERARRDRGVAW